MSRPSLDTARSLILRASAPASAIVAAFVWRVLRALDESRQREGALLLRQYQHQYLTDPHKRQPKTAR